MKAWPQKRKAVGGARRSAAKAPRSGAAEPFGGEAAQTPTASGRTAEAAAAWHARAAGFVPIAPAALLMLDGGVGLGDDDDDDDDGVEGDDEVDGDFPVLGALTGQLDSDADDSYRAVAAEGEGALGAEAWLALPPPELLTLPALVLPSMAGDGGNAWLHAGLAALTESTLDAAMAAHYLPRAPGGGGAARRTTAVTVAATASYEDEVMDQPLEPVA